MMWRKAWSWRAKVWLCWMHISVAGVFSLYGLAGIVATTYAPPAIRPTNTTTSATFHTLPVVITGAGGGRLAVAFRSASRTMSLFTSRGWTDCRCLERFSALTGVPQTGHLLDDAIEATLGA